MNIITYQTEAEGPKKWLAHLDLGRDIYMSFFGAYKIQAVERAENWYARERAHQLVLEAGCSTSSPDPKNLISEAPIKTAGLSVRDGRFIGAVWMLNRQTGQRARVAASEVAQFEADGYQRGGPRSK